MVANRHLPYEAALRDCFHEVEELTPPGGRDGAFRVIRAERPIAHATKPEKPAPETAARRVVRRRR
jgi:16S rRNA (guanine1207-N2)-methyltransferase